MLHRYAFVGLTEEMELSVRMLETLLPRFFRGATHVLQKIGGAHGSQGASHYAASVSDASVKVLKELSHGEFDKEVAFYEAAKAHFWQHVRSKGMIPQLDVYVDDGR